jgi:DNA polymerase-3 subunit gamma/tau
MMKRCPLSDFEHIVELIRRHRDVKLLVELEMACDSAAYQPGRIEFVAKCACTILLRSGSDHAYRLGPEIAGPSRWSMRAAAKQLRKCATLKPTPLRDKAQAHPLHPAVLMKFPVPESPTFETKARRRKLNFEALPEVDDEWDPLRT